MTLHTRISDSCHVKSITLKSFYVRGGLVELKNFPQENKKVQKIKRNVKKRVCYKNNKNVNKFFLHLYMLSCVLNVSNGARKQNQWRLLT